MKKSKIILVVIFLFVRFNLLPELSYSQCLPTIKIDANSIIADENHQFGIKLPAWIGNPQTLEKGDNVFSISVIEFTVNGTVLDYSQNKSVTTIQTVPSGKVWKIESIFKNPQFTPSVVATYSTAGSSTFTPTCHGTYNIKAWGAGGGGAGGNSCCNASGGGGGGGGGYSEGNFFMTAGTNYTVVVGSGGSGGGAVTIGSSGGSSSVSIIGITATGGGGGNHSNNGCCGTGGVNGTGSGGQNNVSGGIGTDASSTGGAGGIGANGGAGGAGGNGSAGVAGTAPGGGGGGGDFASNSGGAGAVGKVIISIGSSGGGIEGSSSGSRDKLQVVSVINATITSACGYIVPAGRVFRLDATTTNTAGQTLEMGTSCGSTDRGQMLIYNPISGNSGGSTHNWPYPQWFAAGTYFSYTSGTAYIQGVEFEIQQ